MLEDQYLFGLCMLIYIKLDIFIVNDLIMFSLGELEVMCISTFF